MKNTMVSLNIYPLGFMLATGIKYFHSHDVLASIGHGLLSWIYVGYVLARSGVFN